MQYNLKFDLTMKNTTDMMQKNPSNMMQKNPCGIPSDMTHGAKRKMSKFQQRNIERYGHELNISEKAYETLRQRIIHVNNLFGLDDRYMLWLFEEYLCGRKHKKSGGGLSCDMAFEMLRPEIDRAMERSMRARRQARQRSERKREELKRQGEQSVTDGNGRRHAAEVSQDCRDTRPGVSVLEVNERNDVARAHLYGNEQHGGKGYGLQHDRRRYKSAFDRRGDA